MGKTAPPQSSYKDIENGKVKVPLGKPEPTQAISVSDEK